MKIKFKLSLMVIIIMAVVVTGVAVLELRQASDISMKLSIRGISYLDDQQVTFWEGRENRYMDVLRTLAAIMANYESVPPEQRRDRYDDILLAALMSQPNFVRVFSVWKPNALDGMDNRYITRPGSTPTGQYAMTWGRDTGKIVVTPNLVLDAVMAHLNGPEPGKEWVEDPVSFKVNGEDTYIVRMGVPVTNPRTNEVVAMVTCLLNVAGAQEVVTEIIKSHDEIAAMSIYSNSGFVIASYVPDRVGKKLIDVDTIYGDHLQEVNQAVLQGKPFEGQSYSPLLGTNVEIELKPIRIGNSDTTWSVMIASAESYIMKEVNHMKWFTVILASIAILAAAVIVYVALNGTTKAIVSVANTLKDISEGEGDLTRSIAVTSKDEIGDLALYFNNTLTKIKNLVLIIKKEAVNLNSIGSDLASNMTETAAAINEITANIQSIKGRVINQSASVTQTNATMEQVINNIDKLNGHVENQSRNVSQASSAIEEMVANISSVTQKKKKNTDNVNSLKEASEVGRTGLQEVATDIQEIARESEGLLEINSVMENIASQTNLLSMNAAIEAAHAGEAGKGFAVVADEIRKLAESSSAQSKTIGNVLKKIKNSIDKITKSTENVLARFEAIDTGVKTVAEQEENIRNAMEEQGQGSKQVLQSASELNGLTQQVKSGSEEMLEGSKEVMKESQNLEKATQEITGGMNEMAEGADQVNIAVNHVNEISARNREGIETLMREVSRFKVE
ncbi:MAG: methyl-accepting chemotaxis protein [Treponema sp.]|jgi:methyl-accepting chemotaxis protein|nr:methyl-accepting chemotaxis protein [Treponema sp.]